MVSLQYEEDERTGYRNIYGTRISEEGEIVDTCGILISGGSFNKTQPYVAFGWSALKDNFLVLWCDSAGLMGSRIQDSEVIDSPGILIISDDVYSPVAAYDGTSKYMVVWQTLDGDIKGKTVDVDGNVSGLFTICAETGNQAGPKISFNGTNFFVVWQDHRSCNWEVYGARVTPDGTVLDPGGIDLANATGERYHPDVGFSSGYWLCVWADTRNGKPDIYGTRVDANGNVQEDTSIIISEGWRTGVRDPSVSSDGSKFIVAYIDTSGHKDLVNAIVQSDGTVISHNSTTNTLVTSRTNLDIAFSDTVYFALWCHYGESRYGIVGTRIDRDGNYLDGWYGLNVGITATKQRRPDCAIGGDSALVVWEDNLLGVEGELVDLSGNPLEKIYVGYSTGQKPTVAFTDPYYFCTWIGPDSTIRGRRITREGVALQETISICDSIPSTSSMDIDGGAGTFCLVWINPNDFQIYGSNLDTAGLIWQPAQNVSNIPPGRFANSVSVSFNDSSNNYLIAWDESDFEFLFDSIYCRAVGGYGGILSNRIPIGEGGSPSIAFDGTNYFCVWENGGVLIGKWLNISWEIVDSSTIPFNMSPKRVSHCDDGYLIVGEKNEEVWALKVTLSGDIIDSLDLGPGNDPSATAKNNTYFITWSAFTPYPYSSFRIWGYINSFVGVKEKSQREKSLQGILVFPNPFTSFARVEVSGKGKKMLKIYDVTGRMIRQLPIKQSATIGKKLGAGVYFLKIDGYKAKEVVKVR